MTDYQALGTALGKLVAEKNAAYGSSFSKTADFFRLLYPDGLRPEQYGDALLLARCFDKMVRIATDKDAFGESPFGDLAGYGLLGMAQCKENLACPPEEDPGVGLIDDEEGAWEGIPPACKCPEPGCEFEVPGPNPCDCTADPYSKYSCAEGTCRRHGFRWVCPAAKP